MRIETIEVYEFTELSEEAKEAARDWYCTIEASDPPEDWVASMGAFADIIGISLIDWVLAAESNRSYVQWAWKDKPDTEGMTPLRLRTWIINNWLPEFKKYKYLGYSKKKFVHIYSRIQYSYSDCPLTGCFTDMGLIATILNFVNAPDDRILDDLITDAFEEMFCQLRDEYTYHASKEYIDEMLEINSYEFTENGNIY